MYFFSWDVPHFSVRWGLELTGVNWKLCACLFIYELLFTALHETAKGKIQNKY